MPKKPYLEAGMVVGTHGVQGELRIQPWCDSPQQFCTLKTLYWDAAGQKPVSVKSRAHKSLALVKMEGVDTVEAAAALRGRVVYLDRNDLDLKGRHFIQDLIGLKVVDAEDASIVYGEITDVSATGANDVYHMRTTEGTAGEKPKEILIPVIPSVIIGVDVDGGIVRLRPMKGLLDDED